MKWRSITSSAPDRPEGFYFQGHASPGIYARALLEGRLTEQQLANFRQELSPGGGLSSYPHPWLMPNFWQFPTVSMGLGPIMAIYQARFNKYLMDRGIKDTSNVARVVLHGRRRKRRARIAGRDHIGLAREARQPHVRHQLQFAAIGRPGPRQRQNHSRAGSAFRGAGWNVIKVDLGRRLGSTARATKPGLLVQRMGEVVDGEYQKYIVSPGSYIREHFFGKYPELEEMVAHLSDEKLQQPAPRRS